MAVHPAAERDGSGEKPSGIELGGDPGFVPQDLVDHQAAEAGPVEMPPEIGYQDDSGIPWGPRAARA
jgi:hypothetical protein